MLDVLYVNLTGKAKYNIYLEQTLLNLKTEVLPYTQQSTHAICRNGQTVAVCLLRSSHTHPTLAVKVEYEDFLTFIREYEELLVYTIDCLSWAVMIKDHGLLLEYLNQGAKVSADDDRPVMVASELDDMTALHLLTSRGANYHTHGEYCLAVACKNDNYEMVSYLLNSQAKPYARGGVALHTALQYSSDRVVELMLAKMPHLTRLEYLQYKLQWGRYKAIRFLASIIFTPE